MIDIAPIISLRIKLQRTTDVPCAACGETVIAIGQGVGPHTASLRCAACERHRGWLSKETAEILLAMVGQFGRPTEPLAIRNSTAFTGADAAEVTRAPQLQLSPERERT
jgi:hypothetical protein